ncbi:hypothetical protein ASD58_16910 [Duganella sp. Root1480D1]|nr:hypothetical protein ASD58_16910 [Duganella sp. Root1480D1]
MRVIACLAFAVCSTAPLSAGAGVIDFEDLPHLAYFEFSSQISRDYLITHGGNLIDPFAYVVGPAGEDALDFSGNGSKRLVAFNSSAITVSRPGGGAFDLLQFDGGESWLDIPHVWARQIQVVGQLQAGGSVSQVFTLDLIKNLQNGLQPFILGNTFRDLVSVTFSGLGATGGGPEFSLDNLVVAQEAALAIDAPPAIWLAGAGLAALALARRRRISSAVAVR